SLAKLGNEQINTSFFDTIVVKADAEKVKAIAVQNEVNFYYIDNNTVQIALNETTNLDDIIQIIAIFAKALGKDAFTVSALSTSSAIDSSLVSTSSFLQHEV